ncbi:MAG TPA: IS256 family transposase [Bdellovibrionales bacterium]|nr:IS256 family transposase [Bdellovibrionales bacterium]
MPVKREELEQRKQDSIEAAVAELNQLDLPSTSLMSLLQFGSGMLLKHAIAGEITEYLGRAHYQHGPEFKGHRNGYQKTRLDTPLGVVEYDRPKLAGAPDFHSQYHVRHMRRPGEFADAVTDMYINGISTRKVKASLKAAAGSRARLSKSTVSRITKRLRDEFTQWKTRSLAELDIAYLFLDAIRIGMRLKSSPKDAVLIAYGITPAGRMELLAIDFGHSESGSSWGKFVSDLKAHGLKDPLLVCSDGNSGLINAIEANFTTSYRQRCVKHREQNILDAVPKKEQSPVRQALKRIFYGATSLEQAKGFVKDFKKSFGKTYPTAFERLMADLDQCLVFYLFPANHWKRIRTSNKLERLNKEIKRRLKVLGRHPDEHGCLSLIYAVSRNYAQQQNGFTVDDLEKAIWLRLREKKIEMLTQLELDVWVA